MIGISDIASFINIHRCPSGNNGQALFVRGIGCSASFCDEIRAADTTASSDGHYLYRRITAFPPLPDSRTSEYYSEKYGEISTGSCSFVIRSISDHRLNSELCGTLRRVCDAVKGAKPNFTPTMEKNLGAALLYWTDMLLPDFLRERDSKFCKMICSGKIGYKEYSFCYLAVLMGIDVLMLFTEGEPDIPRELLDKSASFTIGAPQKITVPEYSAVPAKKAPVTKSMADLTRHRPQGNTVSASPTSNAVSASNSPDVKYTVDLTRPPKRKASSAASPSANRPTNGPTDRNIGGSPVNTSAVKRELTYEELAALAESVVLIEVNNRFGKTVGTGSGIVINNRGYILTNCHVASGGASYSVRIENDDTAYPAYNVIKYHPLLDLAVIRIDKYIKPLTVYNGTAPLKRGQRVVAIGSPLGLFNSVSDGIISGFRTVRDVEMIQFTAPISHGSSGGAVLNMYGEVIGISTAGIEGGQNINLAVGYEDINPFISNFI